MGKQEKKTFKMRTQANMDGELNVQDGLEPNNPLKEEDNDAGDSVDKHKELESANQVIAEKEIEQVNHNS
ncbi:hypothetical protein SAMN04488072_106207 [Lentibacillus halodurans]|uniref:Uncharacterized protein n=1 Tax=Lentibacillus halodurans TaxID=237679 RepID=A0A1I0Y4R8_9BACI|nr:hypothetical protein [Lentibacillus halodurans]SFB07428.1 hypothetical protein SAMN04488072_106207 [Lentibacillus halodurans]